MKNVQQSKKLIVFSIVISLFLFVSCVKHKNNNANDEGLRELNFLHLSNPPGAVTDHSITLVWGEENPIPENQYYSILQDGTPIGKTSSTFYRVEGLKSDSMYAFELTLHNEKDKIIGKSNTVKARAKSEGESYVITDFGAYGDDITLNTKAIQSVIDKCSQNGTVIIPKGTFVTGALFVKSNMTLYLEKGAILKGSKDKAHYPVVRSRYEGRETDQYASLINGGELCGKGIQNFAIRGEGTINGEGETLFLLEKKRDVIKRGRILSIINGENIYLEGVSFIHSPSRAVHLIYSNGITVEGIVINTRYNSETGERYQITNGDGLTLGSSKNAYIFNSVISSQDDNISLKSGRDQEGRQVAKSTKHVRIFETQFLGGLGVVCGSEMSGGISDIIVNNCYYENTAFVAQLKAPWGRGGVIENITYKNITHSDTIFDDNKWFWGGICIDQYYGDAKPDFTVIHSIDENMPLIRDVLFENISLSKKFGQAIYLCGRPEKHLKNIVLKNISAKAPLGLNGKFIDQIRLEHVAVEQGSGEAYIWDEVENITVFTE